MRKFFQKLRELFEPIPEPEQPVAQKPEAPDDRFGDRPSDYVRSAAEGYFRPIHSFLFGRYEE